MAYQPPASSKYGPPLELADPNKPSPFARTRGVGHTDGFQSAAASAFQGSRNRQAATTAETDWTSFGANKRQRREEMASTALTRAPIDTNRNSLSAFVQAVTGSLPPAPEEKWSQSAIRKPAATKPEPAVKKSYEDLFPTLGKKTPSNGNLAKSESTESLSFADLMKKRVREEEEANRQRALEDERLARQREEEERQNRMMGIVRRIRLGNNARTFETSDDEDMADEADLDSDVYGFRRTHGDHDYTDDAYDSGDDDIRSTTPPYA